LKVVSVMAENNKPIRQSGDRTAYPQLLAPADENPDPTPLLTTLARVALAIARRRSQAAQQPGQSEQAHEGD
jgi:hypothetical protein